MAATSPTTASIRAPCPGLNRVSLPCCLRRPRRATPWWRPPRCSRKGKSVARTSWRRRHRGDQRLRERMTKSRRPVRCVGWLRIDGVAADISSIAAPAVLALAADPVTALVDTAFVGHIRKGSDELAAVGASASVFNLISKLFNVPLLNVTTSFVAEQQAVNGNSSNTTGQRDEFLTPEKKASQQRKVLPAVSTSLALAAGIGLLEMVALIVGSGTLMDIIGIPVVRKTNLLAYSDS
ncbi:hypothetical protein GQ55_3G004800 [Panicum hallii var. hallii]|uniref:Protein DETOXIFICATION n=1 Tax=Panicum hallii var. hallii TaxID=1504633 RepID=A0A2T7E4C4_9POAL|nr:hypothetical protein GQ55_3G004800 [Panicum hallii var. hallii]